MTQININEQKKLALDILIYFASYCEKNNLQYFLAYGTLLGAIRHKGFIPWDDDIDVIMPRNDYIKFIEKFKNHPFYKVVDNSVIFNYCKSFAVLNDIRTTKIEKLLRNKYQTNVSVNIDIFPVDTLPDNPIIQKKLLNKIKRQELKIACLTYKLGKGQNLLSSIKKNIGILIFRFLELLKITNLRAVIKKHNSLMQQYNNLTTNTIGCLANTGYNGIKEFLPAKIFKDYIYVDFEGYKFRAPKEYDLFLKSIYADYMTPPPTNKRVSHHNHICYWKDSFPIEHPTNTN